MRLEKLRTLLLLERQLAVLRVLALRMSPQSVDAPDDNSVLSQLVDL